MAGMSDGLGLGHPASRDLGAHVCQRFRKGVGGRGLATNKPPKKSQRNPPEMCPPSPKGGIGKRVQKRGQNLGHMKDFLAPTPSVRQPLFETSECVSGKTLSAKP